MCKLAQMPIIIATMSKHVSLALDQHKFILPLLPHPGFSYGLTWVLNARLLGFWFGINEFSNCYETIVKIPDKFSNILDRLSFLSFTLIKK